MKSFYILLLVAVLCFGCMDTGDNGDESDSNEDSDEKNDDSFRMHWITDAHWYGDGTFAVLTINFPDCHNCGTMIAHFTEGGELIWKTEGDFQFPHTLFAMGDGFLVSDSDNQRVVEINREGEIVWEFGAPDVGDMHPGIWPNDADVTNDGTILISDLFNCIVYEVNPTNNEILWWLDIRKLYQDPTWVEIHDPDKLDNGNILVCDSTNNKILEIDKEGNIVWEYGTRLLWPRNADRLENGNTLISDAEKCIEVTPEGEIVWFIEGLESAYNVERLEDGTTLIVASIERLIRVDEDGHIIWEFSMVNQMSESRSPSPIFLRPHRKYVLQTLGYLQ